MRCLQHLVEQVFNTFKTLPLANPGGCRKAAFNATFHTSSRLLWERLRMPVGRKETLPRQLPRELRSL